MGYDKIYIWEIKHMKKQIVTSELGKILPLEWKGIFHNFLIYTVPLFLSTFFAQLALGVSIKQALYISLITIYGTLANIFKKAYTQTSYDSK